MKKITLIVVTLFCNLVLGQESRKLNSDTIDNEFTYVNAVNFDFGNTKAGTSYFGHLNYFFKAQKNDSTSKYFINSGILKANYYSPEVNDGSFNQYDYVLEKPNNPTTPGSTYNKEFNKYDFKTKINSLSGYVQFLFKFSSFNSLFVHAHAELLINNYETNIAITTLDTTTDTIQSTNNIPVRNFLNKNISFSKQEIGGYFGGGLTTKMKFDFHNNNSNKKEEDKTTINYFLQGTVGLSNMQLNPKIISRETSLPSYEEKNGAKPFYIIHSYFENDITGIKLIIGSHIRGDFKSAPFYNFYVGINTNLENIKELLK